MRQGITNIFLRVWGVFLRLESDIEFILILLVMLVFVSITSLVKVWKKTDKKHELLQNKLQVCIKHNRLCQ